MGRKGPSLNSALQGPDLCPLAGGRPAPNAAGISGPDHRRKSRLFAPGLSSAFSWIDLREDTAGKACEGQAAQKNRHRFTGSRRGKKADVKFLDNILTRCQNSDMIRMLTQCQNRKFYVARGLTRDRRSLKTVAAADSAADPAGTGLRCLERGFPRGAMSLPPSAERQPQRIPAALARL